MTSTPEAVLKQKIATLEAELEKTRKESRQYLQNVAHQLSAPLGAIKWSIEALKDEKIPIKRKGVLLSSIYSQGGILVHLVKNFSLMSNLEQDHELGQFRDKPEPEDMMLMAINLANDFQPQAFDVEKKIVVDEAAFKKTFGRQRVLVVKNLIAQAISNLLENAVKYADRGTAITVSAQQAPMAAIMIRSVGVAIKPDEAHKIFDRNYRGQEAKQKIAPGTGIGLYLAKRVVTMHGGKIWVEPAGKESSFYISFPKERIL
jgi:signal transduction histidine kinase